jgi:hypothetical protein
MRPRLVNRPLPRLAAVVLMALAPKCLVCMAAYVGLGGALGLVGPEICGGTAAPAASWLPVLGGTLGATAIIGLALWRRRVLINP